MMNQFGKYSIASWLILGLLAAETSAQANPATPELLLAVDFSETPRGVYHEAQARKEWPGMQWFALRDLERGRWYHLTQRIKVNTSGQRDRELQVWLRFADQVPPVLGHEFTSWGNSAKIFT